jgi:hypothetical protein
MYLTRRNRTAAMLIVAALLAISPEAFAKDRRTRPRAGQRQTVQRTSAITLLAQGWSRLVSSWLGEGGQIDPDGRSSTTPSIPPPPPPPPVEIPL